MTEQEYEKLIESIMADAEKDGEPVTREEAEEIAKMEIGAREITNYVQSDTEKKKRAPRERKVDEEKKSLLELLKSGLPNDIECTVENEVKLHFVFNNSNYTVTLTKHRDKKG